MFFWKIFLWPGENRALPLVSLSMYFPLFSLQWLGFWLAPVEPRKRSAKRAARRELKA
jgi:hypothetical protein